MGLLIAVVGPSGVGKDTLLDAARARYPHAHFPKRVITRPSALGGEDFEGVTEGAFEARVASGAIGAHWRAHGLRYGIPATLDAVLASGRVAFVNASRASLSALTARYPNTQVIAVTASLDILAARLASRGRETPEAIQGRLDRARAYRVPAGAHVVDNGGSLDEGIARFCAAVERCLTEAACACVLAA